MYETVMQRLHASFDELPPKLQTAARFLIDRPKEVALLSMREQARIANVQPATMLRLAQWLGFSGFDELRRLYADALRGDVGSFSSRSVTLVARQQAVGDAGLITDHVNTIVTYLGRLKSQTNVDLLIAAADCLKSASTIYTLGVRSVFPVAYQIAYVQSYFSDHVVLLDGPGSTGPDRFQHAASDSVLIVTSLEPYASSSIALAREAYDRGIKTVAITDSLMSPIGRIATVAIPVEKLSASFFDTITPAFVVGEILVALLAAHAGPGVTSRIRETETRYRQSNVFWSEGQERKLSKKK